MYEHVNEGGEIEFDNREAIRLAKQVQIQGDRLHNDILPYLFSEMTDSDLAAFSGQAGEISEAIENGLRRLRANWKAKLATLIAWGDFGSVLESAILLQDSVDAAAWEELDRRFDTRR